MNAKRMLLSSMSRHEAKRIAKSFEAASVAAAGISAHGQRRMRLLALEATRSPSVLVRAGERAEQVQAIVVPAAAVITAGLAVLGALLDFRDRLKKLSVEPAPAPEAEAEETGTTS